MNNASKGEWLNGRATVSKTVGCVFESRLPCHNDLRIARVVFAWYGRASLLLGKDLFRLLRHARLRNPALRL